MKRRWVYIDGVAIEDGENPVRDHNRVVGDLHYTNLQATDGTDISTRTKHREYMKQNNLTTVDDFRGEWAGAEKKRDEYRTTGKGGAVRRGDIERAIYDLQKK